VSEPAPHLLRTRPRRAGDAALTWRVLGMTCDPDRPDVMIGVRTAGGFGADCGHYHDTADEAFACPWEPADPPELYAGIVRQVRDDRPDRAAGRIRQVQGTMPWG
jgi:hypothetical protein